jgi:hypothetical protein
MDEKFGPYSQFLLPLSKPNSDDFWRSVLRDVNSHRNWVFLLKYIDEFFVEEFTSLVSAANVYALLSLGLPNPKDFAIQELHDIVTEKVWRLILLFCNKLESSFSEENLNAILIAIRSANAECRDTERLTLYAISYLSNCGFFDNNESLEFNSVREIFFNNRDVIDIMYSDIDEDLQEKLFYSLSRTR